MLKLCQRFFPVINLILILINFSAAQVRGTDNRVALDKLIGTDTSYVTLAEGNTVQFGGSGRQLRIKYSPFGTVSGMCEDEKFSKDNKILTANCSGTLVAPNVVLTAQHCMGPNPADYCQRANYLFGVTAKNTGNSFSTDKSFRTCSKVIATGGYDTIKFTNPGKDWALIELNSPVEGAEVAKIAPKGLPKKGETVYTIGTPQGIPAIKSTGKIDYVDKEGRGIKTDMDVVGGNSGGGVFNSKGELIGVVTTSYEAGRIFFYEPSGCARWAKENPVTEQHDGSWVTGNGFIPIDYFREDLEKYLKSTANQQNSVHGSPGALQPLEEKPAAQ